MMQRNDVAASARSGVELTTGSSPERVDEVLE